jgi:hypothetical protein
MVGGGVGPYVPTRNIDVIKFLFLGQFSQHEVSMKLGVS